MFLLIRTTRNIRGSRQRLNLRCFIQSWLGNLFFVFKSVLPLPWRRKLNRTIVKQPLQASTMISMNLLQPVHHTFLKILKRRVCVIITPGPFSAVYHFLFSPDLECLNVWMLILLSWVFRVIWGLRLVAIVSRGASNNSKRKFSLK